MRESILNHKALLLVDDEPDILEVLKEEILFDAPNCTLDTATTYEKAIEHLTTWTYDLAILDIMGVQGFDLLNRLPHFQNQCRLLCSLRTLSLPSPSRSR